MNLTIRHGREEEFLAIHRFVSGCGVLESYAEHLFRIVLRYFGNTSYVAEREGRIVGLMWGFRSQKDPGTFFLWQIGVDPGLRGAGIADRIMAHAEEELARLGYRRIELTVAPDNAPSRRLFEKRGYENVSAREGKTVEVDGALAIENYYRPAGHFMMFEKRLRTESPELPASGLREGER